MAKEEEEKALCPCCGKRMVDAGHTYDICEVCGWEDDNNQFLYPDDDRGANGVSLNKARLMYKKTGRVIKSGRTY